jgi:hypothetical protein
VLVVDVDPQADASTMLGVDPDAQPYTLYDVLVGSASCPAPCGLASRPELTWRSAVSAWPMSSSRPPVS